jgi:MFS transporter, PAT family, beta-lactamase induction signal transducer AmpG
MSPSHIRARAPVWLMGLSNAPIGLVGGFIVLPLPQMLAAQGVPEWKIAAVSAACLSPGFFVFLLGPILDLRFTRRFYATLFAALAGLGLTVAVLLRAHLLILEISIMTAYAASVLSSNALGGWLAGVIPVVAAADRDNPNHEGARLSAWTQVGLFLGNGLMAALAAEGLRRLPLNVIAPLLGLLVFLPAAIFPWIPTPEPNPDAPTQTVLTSFRNLIRELRALLKRREVLLTLLLFTAPTGSFALTNQLSGVAHDFHASDAFVGRMGGAVLSLAGAIGALLLPILSRRIKALPLYLLIGTVGSLFTLTLLLLPRSPATFAVSFLGENIVQALSFTAAVAICFATIGRDNSLAATQFSLLTSATVLPILYMGVLDGHTYTIHGLSGMYLADGAISLAACILMALIMRRFARQAAAS